MENKNEEISVFAYIKGIDVLAAFIVFFAALEFGYRKNILLGPWIMLGGTLFFTLVPMFWRQRKIKRNPIAKMLWKHQGEEVRSETLLSILCYMHYNNLEFLIASFRYKGILPESMSEIVKLMKKEKMSNEAILQVLEEYYKETGLEEDLSVPEIRRHCQKPVPLT